MDKKERYLGAEKAAEVCMIWPKAAADQMGRIIEQCDLTNALMSADKHISGNGSLASSAGFAAEAVTAETYNLDAELKGLNARAYTDAYRDSPLPKHDPVRDIVVMKDGRQVQSAQLKFYKTPEATANACRDIKSGVGHYNDVDSMVVPSDQLEGVKAAARKTKLKNLQTRPQVADAARQVQEKASDRLSYGGAESSKLTKKDAEQIAREVKSGEEDGLHQKIQGKYKTASTIRQSANAAVGAAAVTTVIAGTINTISCLEKVKRGEMNVADAMKYILKNTAIAATDSAVKAAGATAAVSLTARALPSLFKGSMLSTGLVAGGVGGAAICAIDVVECLVKVAAGKMTWDELETRTGKNLIQVGAGVIGSAIGGAVGSVGGPIGTMAGALIGGLITSLAATVAIENQIEKPYFETLKNTRELVQAEEVMNIAINYLNEANIKMEEFRQWLIFSEMDFDTGMATHRQRRRIIEHGIHNL